MKTKYFTLLAAIGAIIATSCQKKEIEQPQANDNDVIAAGAKDFIALFDGVNLKSTLDQNRVQIWSEGDAIGITTADDGNLECVIKNVSAGIFDGEDIEGGAPYYAVYPYSADNTFSGDVLTAILPAEQVVGQGEKMAKGVMVAACKSESNTLEFKNCVTLLQLTIPCDTIKKVEIAATTEGQYLAGKFTMDLEGNNALVPTVVTDDSANEPSPSVVLKAEDDGNLAAGTYYMAVLPGTTALQITFTNSVDQSVVVKKTAAVTLGRSTGVNLGNFFVYDIGTADELITWAKQTAKYTVWDVVNITKDIALTPAQAASYAPAHEFKGEFNGNGKTISGLITPLFGHLRGAHVHDITIDANVTLIAPQQTIEASAKNLKGSDYGMGLLAQYAYADQGVATPKLKSVTTKGSLTINFTGGVTLTHHYNVGGIVGGANNVPLEDCTNEAAVTVENIEVTSGSLFVGGICGANQSGANATLTKCINNGNVSASNGVNLTSTASGEGYCSIAGISGRDTQPVPFVSCKNFGAVTNSASQASAFYTAGICSRAEGSTLTFTTCENSGAILDESAYATAKSHYVAGIVGYAVNTIEVEGCKNTGTVTNSANASPAATAGICARVEIGTTLKFKDCINSGAILDKTNSTSESNHSVAGIVGYTYPNKANVTQTVEVEGCSNTGTVTNSASKASTFYTAGICGYAGYEDNKGDNIIKITDCVNSGVVLDNSAYTTAKTHYVAGIVGVAKGKAAVVNDGTVTMYINITGCSNEADVTIMARAVTTSKVGGICADAINHAYIYNCTNGTTRNSCTTAAKGPNGATVTATSACFVAGILANSGKANNVVSCTNYAKVSNECKANTNLRIGGIVGNSSNNLTAGVVTEALYDGCKNYGDIEDVSENTKEGRCAGIVGSSTNGKITIRNCENYGNILSSSTIDAARLGGILGYVGDSAGSSVTSCISNAEIKNDVATPKGKYGEILGESIAGKNNSTSTNPEISFYLSNNRLAGKVNGEPVTSATCEDEGVLYGAVIAVVTANSGNALYTPPTGE